MDVSLFHARITPVFRRVWSQVKEQKEEAEKFKRKLKEIEELKVESFLVQLFHINRVSRSVRQPTMCS